MERNIGMCFVTRKALCSCDTVKYCGKGMTVDMKKIYARCVTYIKKRNESPIGKLDWVLLAAMAGFMLLTMFYADLPIIYNHSLTFLDSLFTGDMANFYANSLAKPYDGFGAVYYWTVYAVIGAWNLPIWILQKFFGANAFSIKAMLWCRLEMVVFLFLTLWMMEKLMQDFGFGKEKCRFAQFLFASSLLVILPVAAISQIDIITVFLMLWGIREYLKSDKISWKFLLIFSFAASLKIFALFVFIPLVLLREKRIFAVVKNLLVGVLFILACMLPYAGREDYVEATSILNDIMVERMFEVVLPAGNLEIPAFLTILVGISIWAYATKLKFREEYFYYINWIVLAVFAAFFIFVFAHPYWIVLLAPYVVMLLVMNTERMKMNVLLEFFMEAAVTVVYVGVFGVYMTDTTFSDLVLNRIGYQPVAGGYASFRDWVTKMELDPYIAVLFGVFAVCTLAILALNRPGKVSLEKVKQSEHVPYALEWKEHIKEKLEFDHGMMYLRLVMILAYIFGCIYFSYIN